MNVFAKGGLTCGPPDMKPDTQPVCIAPMGRGTVVLSGRRVGGHRTSDVGAIRSLGIASMSELLPVRQSGSCRCRTFTRSGVCRSPQRRTTGRSRDSGSPQRRTFCRSEAPGRPNVGRGGDPDTADRSVVGRLDDPETADRLNVGRFDDPEWVSLCRDRRRPRSGCPALKDV